MQSGRLVVYTVLESGFRLPGVGQWWTGASHTHVERMYAVSILYTSKYYVTYAEHTRYVRCEDVYVRWTYVYTRWTRYVGWTFICTLKILCARYTLNECYTLRSFICCKHLYVAKKQTFNMFVCWTHQVYIMYVEPLQYAHGSKSSHRDRERDERGELLHDRLVPVGQQRGRAR